MTSPLSSFGSRLLGLFQGPPAAPASPTAGAAPGFGTDQLQLDGARVAARRAAPAPATRGGGADGATGYAAPATDAPDPANEATASADAPDPSLAPDPATDAGPDRIEAPVPAIDPLAVAAAPAADAAPAPASPSYTVQAGDTLGAIAAVQLGDAARWPELFALNQAVIGADANVIRPGQMLALPESAPGTAPEATPAAPRPDPTPAAAPEATPAPGPVPAPTPAPVAGPHSEIQVDRGVEPRAHSTIPGYEDQAEQCGEFVARYFKSQGKDYPTTGQPYNYLMGPARPGFDNVKNGSPTPPKAGDILVCKGPKPGQFHTALVTKVDGDHVTVYQGNVPYNWQGGKSLFQDVPLAFDGKTYSMPDFPTSKAGYDNDYPVAGWIHPTGANKLPGAPD